MKFFTPQGAGADSEGGETKIHAIRNGLTKQPGTFFKSCIREATKPQGANMLVRDSIVMAMAFSFSVIPSSTTPVGAASPDDAIARYAQVDGWLELTFDRNKRRSTSVPLPKQGQENAAGRIVTDSISYEYGDCSTAKLVCADFVEIILSVPRRPVDSLMWKHEDWIFTRTACLDQVSNLCVRYLATFTNSKKGHEGGFIYSNKRGIEMYFDTNTSRKEQRQIYVLTSTFGLLYGNKP